MNVSIFGAVRQWTFLTLLLMTDARAGEDGEGPGAITNKELPMLIANRPDGWHDIKDDDEKYRLDLASRPVRAHLSKPCPLIG